jgi:hypothetical protein
MCDIALWPETWVPTSAPRNEAQISLQKDGPEDMAPEAA